MMTTSPIPTILCGSIRSTVVSLVVSVSVSVSGVETDQGVAVVLFVTAANVTTIDSMAMIDDDDD